MIKFNSGYFYFRSLFSDFQQFFRVYFSDFNTISTYFEANAKKLVDLEIMIGYPDDTFRPKQGLTREELALILYRFTQNENLKS